jgi:hypothetical protein
MVISIIQYGTKMIAYVPTSMVHEVNITVTRLLDPNGNYSGVPGVSFGSRSSLHPTPFVRIQSLQKVYKNLIWAISSGEQVAFAEDPDSTPVSLALLKVRERMFSTVTETIVWNSLATLILYLGVAQNYP